MRGLVVLRCCRGFLSRSLYYGCRLLCVKYFPISRNNCFKHSAASPWNMQKHLVFVRNFSCKTEISEAQYEDLVKKTLEELAGFFDDLSDSGICSKDYDVNYESGVLTVNLGDDMGIYVINKQTPNKEIWLSSPFSGPKRYSIIGGKWVYPQDGVSLHDLLSQELSRALSTDINLHKLQYYTFE